MIRQLKENDSESYYKIRLEGLKLHPEAFGTGAEDWTKATSEQVKNLLANSSQDDFVLGVFHEEKLVGVIGLKREKKHSVGHKGTVWGLFVLPEFRNKGLGRKLVAALTKKSSSHQELKFIRAVVTNTSANAIGIFESLGFIRYGIELRGIKQGSNFFDQTYLAFNLRD